MGKQVAHKYQERGGGVSVLSLINHIEGKV